MSTEAILVQSIGQITAQSSVSGAQSGASQSFNAAFQRAQQRQASDSDVGALTSVLSPLLSLGEETAKLEAHVAPIATNDFRPSELMMVTMRSHEFLFRCELTANVANRASDGVQQLFRQQS